VNQVKLAYQRLADASGVPTVLAVSWEVFELIAAVASTAVGESPDMYPAFTFASGAAVSGRNAIAFAPPCHPSQVAQSTARRSLPAECMKPLMLSPPWRQP
jgi:hypothetical protein